MEAWKEHELTIYANASAYPALATKTFAQVKCVIHLLPSAASPMGLSASCYPVRLTMQEGFDRQTNQPALFVEAEWKLYNDQPMSAPDIFKETQFGSKQANAGLSALIVPAS